MIKTILAVFGLALLAQAEMLHWVGDKVPLLQGSGRSAAWITVENLLPAKHLQDTETSLELQREGICITKNDDNQEERFLVATPPYSIDRKVIQKTLPEKGQKLLTGKPYTILAMGDSVTKTGDYEKFLAAMLQQSTGNPAIQAVERSYPGRSVDASVRHFERDVEGLAPDLVLIMYGLNDQSAGTPLDAYLGQMRWLVKKCRERFHADVVFLTPTPHPDLSREGFPDNKPRPSAARTLGFGAALKDLGHALNVPVIDTFQAIWSRGHGNMEEPCRSLWTLYPQHYAKQMTSLLESPQGGDMIHPNALGHLQIAKEIYLHLFLNPVETWSPFGQASTRWTKKGAVTTLPLRSKITGFQPLPLRETGLLTIFSKSDQQIEVLWNEVSAPADLLHFPGNAALSQNLGYVTLSAQSATHTFLWTVHAPWNDWPIPIRDRQLSTSTTTIRFNDGFAATVELPTDSPSGRISYQQDNHLAEVTYCHIGATRKGECQLDGDLAEWQNHQWEPLGLPHQARWTSGPQDLRKSPSECQLEWASKAGSQGLYIAMKITGTLGKERFTLYFDPRSPKALGTYGPYYWVSGSLDDNCKIRLRQGETSPPGSGKALTAAAVNTDTGMQAELFIPYPVFAATAFPEAAVMGFSMHWMHDGPDGKTNLLWAEDSHPWNSRWYGAIQITEGTDTPATCVIRVK